MEIHLAPLENVTCWAFRKLCKGASDSYTGMLSLNNLVKRNNAWDKVDTFPIKEQRQWIQIATSKEKDCSLFIRKLDEEIKKHPEKNNIYGIQLNASCPSPYIIKIGQGATLIKRPAKIVNILNELLKQDKYKVGIKLRLGLNENEVKQRKIFILLKELEKVAANNPHFTNVTIHLKHAKESSSIDYDYSIVNEIASYNLPLIFNGGIRNYKDIQKLIECVSPENRKNIIGVMIGREALKNPNCFFDIQKQLRDSFISEVKLRSLHEIKEEFNKLCDEHMPKEIFIETIRERGGWI